MTGRQEKYHECANVGKE